MALKPLMSWRNAFGVGGCSVFDRKGGANIVVFLCRFRANGRALAERFSRRSGAVRRACDERPAILLVFGVLEIVIRLGDEQHGIMHTLRVNFAQQLRAARKQADRLNVLIACLRLRATEHLADASMAVTCWTRPSQSMAISPPANAPYVLFVQSGL